MLSYRKPVVESKKVPSEFNQTFVRATMETKDTLRIPNKQPVNNLNKDNLVAAFIGNAIRTY